MEGQFYKRQIIKPMENSKNPQIINNSLNTNKNQASKNQDKKSLEKTEKIPESSDLLKKKSNPGAPSPNILDLDKNQIQNNLKKAFKKEKIRYDQYSNKNPETNLEITFQICEKNENEKKNTLLNKSNSENQIISHKKSNEKKNHLRRKVITIGFTDKQLNKLTEKKYWTDILRMPKMSFIFQDLDYFKEIQNHKKNVQFRKKNKDSRKVISFAFCKPRKGEINLTITARMVMFDGSNRIISSEECFKKFNDIKRIPKEKNIALLKMSNLSSDQIEKKNAIKVYESWKKSSHSIIGNRKFFNRTDSDLNAKRVATMCAKEWRKCFAKQKKSSNDIFVKLKKLSKDIFLFLKRRTKELSEIKRKREKIEQEIRKKEEEKREEKKQKRKIEFLIKQSGIYAEFMASKLGLNQKKADPNRALITLTKEEELQAQRNVKKLISNQKKKTNEYDIINPSAQGLNFADVEIGKKSQLIDTPKSFNGTLKKYQIKGLRWLDNLYSQGINGILADEMGLGKTIQALALLAHISEKKNNWGPFLVIAPAITLFNWYSEAHRFSPLIKVLPYWGAQKDRKIIKKYFQQKYLGQRNSPFHLFVTSYQLAVSDEKTLQRVRWQYIILDEAQAIKNIHSLRWNTLLNLKSRNKLLLTGTPIQNTMAELWALLHFIMPQLFDSHEQFKEWFSKDIEANSQATQKNQLNKTQLDRLHAILKPFMLRRIKKDVEKEIGKKFEHEVYCELTKRQQILYNKIKSKISIESFFHLKANKDKVKNLMNLVMQFRKVCNHPELFERRIARTPLTFNDHYFYPSQYYFSQKLGIKCIFGNFKSNPLNSFYPVLLENYENEIKSVKSFAFILYPIFFYYKNLLGFSEIEFDNLMFPTTNNLYTFIINFHYLMNRRKQPHILNIFSQRGKSNKKFLIQSVDNNYLINKIYIEKVIANPPVLARRRKENSSSFNLWKLSKVKTSKIEFPSQRALITDSCKMRFLEKLLRSLKKKGERALIFCQMTKMMDIIEEFLIFKKYLFFRLDGGSCISDRRDMVNEFQSNPDIFVFLLSTRAGGLGVTLTAADVVIFYDNDWNPTMDAQAADRAHRIGRTKDINIYKLITKKTIEERIVQRAMQKKNVQQTVYSGEVFKANFFKPHEVVDLVFDNEEIKERKDLRTQRALLHAKKTGKNVHEKERKREEGLKKKEEIEKRKRLAEEEKLRRLEEEKEEEKKKKIENEFNDVLKQLGDKMDIGKFL